MTVLRVTDGLVFVEDSVAIPRTAGGRRLRDTYVEGVSRLTAGLIRMRGNSLCLGPIELLRFGTPRVERTSVEWPIEGGLLTGAAGGRYRIEAIRGRLVATLEGYRPRLPLSLYTLTQLPVHHVFTRLYLLSVRGREPAPGVPARDADRLRAAVVDLAFCATLAGITGRPPRLRVFIGVAAAYHLTCWSVWGRTFGGVVMRQRVVAVDGSRPSLGQSVVRFLALPLAGARGRPDHDELAGTQVIADAP